MSTRLLKGKHITVGVCGGIAAYKSAELVRLLVKEESEVEVIMTRNAREFITPLTLQTLSGNPVITRMFTPLERSTVVIRGSNSTNAKDGLIPPKEHTAKESTLTGFTLWPNPGIQHISSAERADAFVISPATANFIGKVANGIADDILSTVLLATKRPVLFAPSMNTNMFNNPILKKNIQKLKRHGYHFIEPTSGYLACGLEGKGRMAEPSQIVEEVINILTTKSLKGRRILITAGPTREHIDPVRFISNPSTGRMGFALARLSRIRGAQVTLIAGPTSLPGPSGVKMINILSAGDMYKRVMENFEGNDIVIMVAAVSDSRPGKVSKKKLKKEGIGNVLSLTPTPDILQEIGRKKGDKMLIGFAAEVDDIEKNAIVKMQNKNLDMIVANKVGEPHSGFGSDTNLVKIIDRDGNVEELPLLSKSEVAMKILDRIVEMLSKRGGGKGFKP